ncbi:MAG: PadR family transcriptional regulator [Alphaproteobacteria bacterium]|nr:PadR family transcriptional regulator [Alphaproteobacteria bacterium]
MGWNHWRKHLRHHRHHRFGPWAWEGRFFERGEIRLALLSLLNDGPKHGYELMKQLEERSGGLYQASPGTIYPLLQQLQDEDLVASSEHEGGKRTYVPTEGGSAVLAQESETIRGMWKRVEDEEWGNWQSIWHPNASEVMRPAFRLMRTALTSMTRTRDPARADRVRDILRRAEEEIRAMDGPH